MWMTDYIKAIKRALRDQHKIKPDGGTKDEPLFDNLPDGVYPVTIEGKLDYVEVVDGTIDCCNFEPHEI